MFALYPWLWLAATVIFAIVEASTAQLVSIWFMAGSVAALVTSLFSPRPLLQLTVFVLVSAITLAFTRPLLAKRLSGKRVATNADRVIGTTACVQVAIDPLEGGRVEVAGQSWAARCSHPLTVGEFCRVDAIDGATLIVSPIKEEVSCQC